jgi:hypothetical protein
MFRLDPDMLDLDLFHERKIDHETVVADGVAGDVVSAAAGRDEQLLLASELDACAISAADLQRAINAVCGRSSHSRCGACRRSLGLQEEARLLRSVI